MKKNLWKTPQIVKKLRRIQLLALDVDGVLTDCRLFLVPNQGWTRSYSIRDGWGIRALAREGIPVVLLSGSKTTELEERVKVLGVPAILGSEDKANSLKEMATRHKVALEDTCYMGDDVFDVPAFRITGLSVTVPGAPAWVKKQADLVTSTEGGNGAARELIEAIFEAKKIAHYAPSARI